jgi:hypothetical protein
METKPRRGRNTPPPSLLHLSISPASHLRRSHGIPLVPFLALRVSRGNDEPAAAAGSCARPLPFGINMLRGERQRLAHRRQGTGGARLGLPTRQPFDSTTVSHPSEPCLGGIESSTVQTYISVVQALPTVEERLNHSLSATYGYPIGYWYESSVASGRFPSFVPWKVLR